MSQQISTPSGRRRKKRKRHLVRRILLIALLMLLLLGIVWYVLSSLKKEYAVNYTGYTASIGSISNSLSFSGSLALVDSQTYTADADTAVRTLYVSPGDEVKKGDTLLRLKNGVAVKADFDGRVNVVSVSQGDEVTAGESLVQLADFRHMKVNIRVDEYDIAKVSVGQRCRITATATERTFESAIDSIDYISSSTGNVAYYTATAYVDVDDGVYPGMQATVTIPQDEAENVVVLKMDALSFDERNSAFVYVYNASGELEQRYVDVGVSNGNYVEIKSGLENGEAAYVETKVQEQTGGGLLSTLFGSQQVTPPSGRDRNRDFSNFSPDSMPFGGMPNGGGAPSGGGGAPGGAPGGGFGGGNR